VSHKFEIYKDRAGEFRVRFKYNEETLFSTGGYASKASAYNAIESIKRNGPEALTLGEEFPEPSIEDRIRAAEAPAADRLVKFDHNSEAFKEFESAFVALKKEISERNNLEFLGSDELELTRAEIGTFGKLKDRALVRIRNLWQFAVNAFLWLAEKAGEAIISTLAVALLVSLAKLLGIEL